MFNFILKGAALKGTQKYLDKLIPKVNINLHEDIPLPSIGLIKKLGPIAAQINGLEEGISKLSDAELRGKTDEYRARYQAAVKAVKDELAQAKEKYNTVTDNQERQDIDILIEKLEEDFKKARKRILDDILPEAFAVVREAGKRTISLRHYDVQMIGGMVLNNGSIAEMTTGEGKTLVATLPVYLNGLTQEGVHVVTVNDYLAKRDSEWMGPVYTFLGLTVGVIQHDMDPHTRQKQYACDITYGTNNEFGFDYLRDNMVVDKRDMVQRGHIFAVVDEVDSILIDEARTPLIISGPAEESTDKYYRAFQISKNLTGRRITEKDEVDAKHKQIDLTTGYDYMADEKHKSVSLTETGEEKAAQLFGVESLHEMETIEYRHHILQALKAKEFFKNDVDYVVRDGEVIIVDEFTGRMMPGRRWSDGLHQAVEAREGIKIERENQTLATITFQNYFRLYDKLSGMTGTAETEATEFSQIYKLDVVVIPTNKKVQRTNYADSIYKTTKEKYAAVVTEIDACYQKGRPVLVGTISIEKSELVSRMLTQKGVKHQVLNAKYHEHEAHIIAQAGRYKGVTIATNMAGRGTDIVLGGNAEHMAKALLEEKNFKDDDPDKEVHLKKFIQEFRTKTKEEQMKVLEVGGLYVIGTERHESRRIDNQLRGRQGRQGDPGSSKFFVSLEDDLMRLFASDRIMSLMDKLGMEEGQVLEHPWLSNALERAQKRVETHNFEIRKHLLEYDNVMNRQREVVYSLRRYALESTDCKNLIVESIADTLRAVCPQYLTPNTETGEVDINGLMAYLQGKFGCDLSSSAGELNNLVQADAVEFIIKKVLEKYDEKERQIDSLRMRHMERMFLLHTIDSKWKDHLYAMDQLKEGVGLRSFAQRDPLMEYKKEGFAMFQAMYESIHQDVAEIIFKIQPMENPAQTKSVFESIPRKYIHNEPQGFSEAAARQRLQPGALGEPPAQPAKTEPIKSDGPRVGRNDPCPCGSGKKHKKCCGQ